MQQILEHLLVIESLLRQILEATMPYKLDKGNNECEKLSKVPRVAPVGFGKPETIEDILNRLIHQRLTPPTQPDSISDTDSDESWLDDDDDFDDLDDYERSPAPAYGSEKQPQPEKVEAEAVPAKSAEAVSRSSDSALASVEKSLDSDSQ